MTPRNPLDSRTLEQLSAHLDGRLPPSERDALTLRLERDAELRAAWEELQAVRSLLRSLPVLRPRRSLALTPSMAARPRFFASISFSYALSSALAALLFGLVTAPAILRGGAAPAAAPAPMMLEAGMDAAPVESTSSEEPLQAFQAAPAETATAEPVEPAGTPPAPRMAAPTPTPAATETGAPAGQGAMGKAGGEETAPSLYLAQVQDASVDQPPAADWIVPVLQILFGSATVVLAVLAIRARKARR